MRLKAIANNQTELHYDDGVILFFSYDTPVAAFIPGESVIATDHFYSTTTSRHISKFVFRCHGDIAANKIPEKELKLMLMERGFYNE